VAPVPLPRQGRQAQSKLHDGSHRIDCQQTDRRTCNWPHAEEHAQGQGRRSSQETGSFEGELDASHQTLQLGHPHRSPQANGLHARIRRKKQTYQPRPLAIDPIADFPVRAEDEGSRSEGRVRQCLEGGHH
jgi:hypothetical protein